MKFALVIIETPDSKRAIQKDRQGHRRQIEQWAARQGKAETLLGGEAFETEQARPVTIRHTAKGKSVIEAPFAGEQETLGGYFLVNAQSREHAIEIAKSWPTPETIEVRPIWVADA